MAVNKNYYNSLKEYIKFPDFIKSNLGIRFLGIIFLTFILLVTTISNIKITPVSLSVEVVSPQYDDIFQVFYDIGKGYNETDSIKAKVTRNNRLTKIVFNLPDKDTNKLRIDTGTQKGHIVIKAIRLKQYFRIFNITTSYIKRWPAKEIIEDFKPINHIVNFYEKNGMLHITATGENPYIQIDNISPIKDLSLILRIVISFLAILFVIVVFYVSKFIYDKFILIKNRILCLSVKNKLNYIGNRISENHLIKFDYKVIILLLIAFLSFILLVFLKIHGSHTGKWDNYIERNKPTNKSNLIFGKPKGIRSDEWLVNTPFILSQVANGFPVRNETIGAEKSPLLMSLPVKHFSIFFRPQLWGFFILDIERGFSYFWNFKTFGLFLSFFFLLILLTRNKFWLSIVGSLWLYFSSFIQWWFSTNMPDIIISFCIIFVTSAYILFSNKKIIILLNSILFIIFSVNFVLFLYPPFQVILVYLILVLLFGFSINQYNNIYIVTNIKYRISLGLFSIFGSIIIILLYYFDTHKTITLVLQTVYPGNRVSIGGSIGIEKYFSGFFDFFYTESYFPQKLGNVCEASNFIFIFPIIIIIIIKNIVTPQDKRLDWEELFLSCYLIFITIWALFGVPQFIAKITLLNKVPSNRSLLGLGIANIIYTITYLSKLKDDIKIKFINGCMIYSLIFIILLIYGLLYFNRFNDFSNLWQILLVSIIFTIFIYSVLNNKRYIFSCLILIIVIFPGFLINPVSYGLRSIFDKDLFKFVSRIKEKNPDAIWITYGNIIDGNYLKASGINVFNGTKYIPDLKKMLVLDPQNKYQGIYNRYANIIFQSNDSIKKIDFKLIHGDCYNVYINPISDYLDQLAIDYVVFPNNEYYSKVIKDSKNRLVPLHNLPISNRWICKIIKLRRTY